MWLATGHGVMRLVCVTCDAVRMRTETTSDTTA